MTSPYTAAVSEGFLSSTPTLGDTGMPSDSGSDPEIRPHTTSDRGRIQLLEGLTWADMKGSIQIWHVTD